MKLLALSALLTIAASAMRFEIPPKAMARLEMAPARVTATKAWFFDGNGKRCLASTPRCRLNAWLRRDDVVLIGATQGGYVKASFTDGSKHMTEGWLLRSAVAPIPAAAAGIASWRGNWVRDDETDITIRRGKRSGVLSFEGDAVFGSHDPERVRRGAVNNGDFSEQGAPRDDRVVFGNGESCSLAMRRVGPYLVVADNDDCGGNNVTFSGVYRRARNS